MKNQNQFTFLESFAMSSIGINEVAAQNSGELNGYTRMAVHDVEEILSLNHQDIYLTERIDGRRTGSILQNSYLSKSSPRHQVGQ